jgi:electron transfer flavoprotein beta subunit
MDRAIHLQGKASADGLANARVIAEQLATLECDAILFGKLAVDDYGQQTGAMVAELMQLPCATAVSKLEVSGRRATVEREVEGGVEQAACALPAVFTCDKGLNNPRLPSLKGIMAAKKKPLDIVPVTVAGAQTTVVSLTLPPERAAGRIVGEGAAAVPALIQLLTTEAKVL